MVEPHLWKQWMVTESLLTNAKRYLVLAAPHLEGGGSEELKQYEEYLEHNELGLALEELAGLGGSYSCRGAFWRSLEQAAEVMQLEEHAAQYRKEFLSVVRGKNDE